MRRFEALLAGMIRLVALPALASVGLTLRAESLPIVASVEFQPLSAQVRRVVEALDMLGQPLARRRPRAARHAHRRRRPERRRADHPGGARPALPGRRQHQPREPREGGPGAGRARAGAERLAVFLVKVHNEAGVTAELAGREPQRRARSTSDRPAAPSRSRRSAPPRSSSAGWTWRCSATGRLKRDALGPGARVPDHPGLQPRRRQARGEDQLQRRPGDAGPRLPQRRRHPLHVRAGRRRSTLDVRDDDGRPTMASFVFRDRHGPRLSLAQPPARPRLLLPPPDLSPERRDRAACRRATTRSSTPAGPSTSTQHRDDHGPRRPSAHRESFQLERWIDLAEHGLVLRRPPRPRRRLRPLREPDRGRQARGHDAAHPGRGPRRRLRADAGARAGTTRSSSSRARSTRSRRPST